MAERNTKRLALLVTGIAVAIFVPSIVAGNEPEIYLSDLITQFELDGKTETPSPVELEQWLQRSIPTGVSFSEFLEGIEKAHLYQSNRWGLIIRTRRGNGFSVFIFSRLLDGVRETNGKLRNYELVIHITAEFGKDSRLLSWLLPYI